jgi:TfoX/Sxy family transcriptional regulator of competence genes
MPVKKSPTIQANVLQRYSELVSTLPGIEVKGATMPYTSFNGNMFSFLAPDGRLNIRLSKTGKAAFMQQHSSEETVQHGIVMKEYASVPDAVWNDDDALKRCIEESYAYALTLKAKATKKKE